MYEAVMSSMTKSWSRGTSRTKNQSPGLDLDLEPKSFETKVLGTLKTFS